MRSSVLCSSENGSHSMGRERGDKEKKKKSTVLWLLVFVCKITSSVSREEQAVLHRSRPNCSAYQKAACCRVRTCCCQLRFFLRGHKGDGDLTCGQPNSQRTQEGLLYHVESCFDTGWEQSPARDLDPWPWWEYRHQQNMGLTSSTLKKNLIHLAARTNTKDLLSSMKMQLYITDLHAHTKLSLALKFHYKECTRNNHYQLYITRCFSLKEI